MAPRHTVHLIDASPYVFRAYYSLPPDLTAPDGSPVNATHGFTRFLVRYLLDERPTHAAVAFDASLTTCFRNDLYPAYKAQRELPPPELEAQLVDCREVTTALGLPVFVDQRYEADDLLATLTDRMRRRGHRVIVVSGDKDLAQLVDEHVTLHDAARGVRYGPEQVHARYGVRPEQIPDWLGLAGDPVDNIPGVRGIGPTTAAALLAHYPDLDAVYADLPGVAGLPVRGARGLVAKLEAGRELARLCRTLATAARDAPAAADLRQLAWSVPEPLSAPVLERLGLTRLVARLRAPPAPTADA